LDLQKIDTSLEVYRQTLDKDDIKRLAFFRGLWALQQGHIDSINTSSNYQLPDKTNAERWYWDEKPLFLMAPVTIDNKQLTAIAQDCAAYIAENAGLAPESAAQLKTYDWRLLIEGSDSALAGRNPASWLAGVQQLALEANPELKAPIGVVLACALRVILEPVASKVAAALDVEDAERTHRRPLHCPTCGTQAVVGFVGPLHSTEGNARMLYCSTCGTTWEFERVRCGRCGSRIQSKLHYYHIEGDSAHRLHLCDECGDYLRTVFGTESLAPLSFEVEDVVMARLDLLAQTPHQS
jgi:FdhE protein